MVRIDIPKPGSNLAKPAKCQGCPAIMDPGPVWGSGNPQPELIIVGEAPGEDEVERGEGFVGTSGSLLWVLLKAGGIHRSNCYVTNTAKCNTKKPGASHFCSQRYLLEELKQFPEGTRILALGNEAKNVLMPSISHQGILSCRGTLKDNVMAALHPAFIRRAVRFMGQAQAGEDKQDLSPTITYDALEARSAVEITPQFVVGIPANVELPEAFVSCDIETAGILHAHQGPVDQIGFGTQPQIAYRERYEENHREIYQRVLRSKPVVFHNMLFDVPFLRAKGYEIPEPHDTMLGAHLLDPDLPLKLEFQSSLYVHFPPWKNLRRSDPHSYHGHDLVSTYHIWNRMEPELKTQGLWQLYLNEVRPVTQRMIEAKQRGFKVDRMRMLRLNIGLQQRIQKVDDVLNKKFPHVDWGSPLQVGRLLYDELKLPEQRNPKTHNRTTDADALEKLADITDNPVVNLLRGRRAYDKMRSTYTNYELDPDDYYHHDVSFTAATGRARGFLLTMQRGLMRSMFIPDEPDWEMAYMDWSGVELFVSAVVSGDKHFFEVLDKMSFHLFAANRCFGGEHTKKSPRYIESKFITHGFNYGRTEGAIAKAHDIPLATVKQFTGWVKSEFPIWASWREDQYSMAYKQGYLENRFGFKRKFWSGNIRSMAYCFEPQSCVGHMIKRVILSLWEELPEPARIVLPVHDALVLTYPKPLREEVLRVAKEHMTQPWPQLGGWRPKVDVKTGSNWQECSDE